MLQLEPFQQEDFRHFWERDIHGYSEGGIEGSKQESEKQAGSKIVFIRMNKTLK